MGFASPLLLALLGLSSVDGFWFGEMQEPNVKARGLQRRQAMECSSGSTDCGQAGCISTAACCNAEADWSCLEGNACYTVDGMVDCYTTTMAMPTVSRACFDYTQSSGCRGGLTCFRCATSSYGYCVTTVLFGGSDTWLNCYTSSTIKTINVAPATQTNSESSLPGLTTGPTTARPTNTRGTSTSSSETSPTPTPDKGGLSGGAIAGIVIGSFAVLTIAAVSLFLVFRKHPAPQSTPPTHPAPPPQPHPQPPYNGYQQPPYQQDQYPQPPYSPQPQYYAGPPPMQHAGGYPGIQSPASPVYAADPTKEPPTSPPAELPSSH